MTDALYWIWLQETLGVGNAKISDVIKKIGSPEALFQMSEKERIEVGIFNERELTKMRYQTLDNAKSELDKAQKVNCTVVTPENEDYPEALTHIDDMPCVLYVRGNLTGLNDELVLTIVGTREASAYGQGAAVKLARDLAAVGCTVASGLAVGIDYAAHEGALSVGGRTIGFLACGIDVDYPHASAELKKHILENDGLLITEFPFGSKPIPSHFNIRNRIMSGVSIGVVVIEAPEISGALNTARHALEQGRDVFAVPGGVFDKNMVGCNRLIADGAKMIRNAYSVLEEYTSRYPDVINQGTTRARLESLPDITLSDITSKKIPSYIGKPPIRMNASKNRTGGGCQFERTQKQLKIPDVLSQAVKWKTPEELTELGLSEKAYKVLLMMPTQAVDPETLSARASIGMMELMTVMTELEIRELVDSLPGRLYRRKH